MVQAHPRKTLRKNCGSKTGLVNRSFLYYNVSDTTETGAVECESSSYVTESEKSY